MTLYPVLTDKERFPVLDDLSFLNHLRQHAFAPLFNFKSGDRLTADDRVKVNQYYQAIKNQQPFWKAGEIPAWVDDYVSTCVDTVPFYKSRARHLFDHPTITRDDLRQAPWAFVSDACDPQDLLVYDTSGTTGRPMSVLFDRLTQATYLPQLQYMLSQKGVTIEGGPEKVAIALVCSQKNTLTYASLSSYLGGAGILKINLNPADWRSPDHRTRFLESVGPQILTGDPFAFNDLLRLKPRITPQALVSSAMKLNQGLNRKLSEYFACPVIDVYSLTECRMVAFASEPGHCLLRHDLFAEVLAPDQDVPLPPGEWGELALTGGNNPFLNLIRYRTGDFCRLHHDQNRVFLVDLEGRQPVPFQDVKGRFVNSVDISRLLTKFNLVAYTVHQNRDRSLHLCLFGKSACKQRVIEALQHLFGAGLNISVTYPSELPSRRAKPIPFSSDLATKP